MNFAIDLKQEQFKSNDRINETTDDGARRGGVCEEQREWKIVGENDKEKIEIPIGNEMVPKTKYYRM